MWKVNKRRQYIIIWSFFMLLSVLALIAFFNWQWIYDFGRGLSYNPSDEMQRIWGSLELTERGGFLFKASMPTLNEREDFNEKCRFGVDSEMAILGCYTEGNIYVYNITDAKLDGIRELTTAHELLHAVWARMGEGARNDLSLALTQVFNDNKDLLEEEISTYGESERQEELYVRAGTEIKNLPELLEKHYAEIFKDQDKIVNFYEKYISVFNNIKAEMDNLMSEMENIKIEIETKTAEYEQRIVKLNTDIANFNDCAETSGCFGSSNEFYARREVLVREQEELNALYEELNDLISKYNERVAKYNDDVIQTEKLNNMINSNSKPGEVK